MCVDTISIYCVVGCGVCGVVWSVGCVVCGVVWCGVECVVWCGVCGVWYVRREWCAQVTKIRARNHSRMTDEVWCRRSS